jgi:hypothetical protein
MKFWLVMCLNTPEIIECFVSKEKANVRMNDLIQKGYNAFLEEIVLTPEQICYFINREIDNDYDLDMNCFNLPEDYFERVLDRKKEVSFDKELPKTIKRHLDWENEDIDIPVTTTWPKGKEIWNIGEHNEQIKNGFVIVTNLKPNSYTIIPASLEYVYVGSSEIAELIMKRSMRYEINPYNTKNLERVLISNKSEDVVSDIQKILEYFKENKTLIGK